MIHIGGTMKMLAEGETQEREEEDPGLRTEDEIHMDIFDNIYKSRISLVKRDVTKFNVNTHYGTYTWLQLAIMQDQMEIVKYFVEECHAYIGMRGYDAVANDMSTDKTALHTAANLQKAAIVTYLLEHGGESTLKAKDAAGKIPQEYARTRATKRAFGMEVEEGESEGDEDGEGEGEYEEEFYGEWSEGISEGCVESDWAEELEEGDEEETGETEPEQAEETEPEQADETGETTDAPEVEPDAQED